MAPAVALVVSLAVHASILWVLTSAHPASAPPLATEIALTLRLEAWQPASGQPAPSDRVSAAQSEREGRTTAARTDETSPLPATGEKRRQPRAHTATHGALEPTPPQPVARTGIAEATVALLPQAPPRTQEAAAADTLVWDLLQRIEQFKSYPRAARRARIEGTARVWMQIDRDGALRGQRLEASSGHRILDEAALALVRRAAPFPPPPGAAPRRIEVVLPVSFRLDTGS
ncbi:MAG TPA: TonB family protein [Xanthomonadaceae bacterium]|nr:TonB family protein [Xanthomonadaceae bacterium]